MRLLIWTCALVALAACSPKPAAPVKSDSAPATAPSATDIKPVATQAPAGDYTLDKAHSSLTFKVSHLGYSNYTAQFKRLDGKLILNPANPSASSITVTVDPRSLDVNAPPAGFVEQLLGAQWLDAAHHPQITFRSTKVELTGPDTARLTGDFNLHGVTKPVTLEVKFNGGYPGMAQDPQARVGFSAHGVIKRSDFGISDGLPAPGTTMGVGDDVDVQIETEFKGPPLQASASAAEPAKSQ